MTTWFPPGERGGGGGSEEEREGEKERKEAKGVRERKGREIGSEEQKEEKVYLISEEDEFHRPLTYKSNFVDVFLKVSQPVSLVSLREREHVEGFVSMANLKGIVDVCEREREREREREQ